MDKKTILTVLRWYNMKTSSRAGVLDIIATSYFWKHKKVNVEVIRWCYADYQKTGRIPDFVKEFVLNVVYPLLLKRRQL